MLDQLAVDVKHTITEPARARARHLPAAAGDSGLREALRAAGGRSPLPVEVTSDGIGATGQRSRRRCTSAAWRPAERGKHAAGAHVQIRGLERVRRAAVTVSDDGPGTTLRWPAAGTGT